jgi:hypothetical protein
MPFWIAKAVRALMRSLMMIPNRDLREHVIALDKEGLLVKIDEQINKDI